MPGSRGGPPSRYVLGGTYFPWADFGDLLEEVTGDRFLRPPAPAAALRWAGWLGDWLARIVPTELPVSQESVTYMTEWAPSDDSAALRDLDLRYRDPRETLRDTIRWMREAGHLWWEYASV